ncbi:glycosyltransferase family 2 protein [Ruminococcus sp.]|uniref:glycosyltransferase family 2 protein n=1 Tax=Ruminococcus sp. TaxID=41978 RepID=UPI002E774B1E|nr:glycosyltransferase family 2 protein [Ruminococcus sp.]MEE1262761.1 glycosyltransferase family 2 protein [Ruminococcus sp.]
MEQNMPLVSIVVPIYRIERYVGICIESLIRQTYQNIEIILVDDGSDDRCPGICDLYAKKDRRIKVIHKSNGGLVSARKAGVERSKGEYIGYVDGDDWVSPGFIERMIGDVLMNDADVVCAGFTRDLYEQSALIFDKYPVGVYRGKQLDDLKKKMISSGDFFFPGITTYVWNKLFKRNAVFDIQMAVDEKITIGEDAAVAYPAIMRSNCVCVTDCTLYHYRQREDSMLKTGAGFSAEKQHLVSLSDYLLSFSSMYDDSYQLKKQVVDYVLGICLSRSGGRITGIDPFSVFDECYYDKNVVIYNAGTFGQQLVNCFNEDIHCNVVKWIDDDFWEYRRCGLDVDSVESISEISFDYVLIATLNPYVTKSIQKRLVDLSVPAEKILTVRCPVDTRESLLNKYLYEG